MRGWYSFVTTYNGDRKSPYYSAFYGGYGVRRENGPPFGFKKEVSDPKELSSVRKTAAIIGW